MGFIQYLKEVKTEMGHVSWPTKQQTIIFTALVIIISIATALYLGLFDALFMRGLRFLIG